MVEDAETFRDLLVATKRVRSSLRTDLRIATAVMAYAIKAKLISSNPMAGVKIAVNRRREAAPSKAAEIHSREEMSAILEAAKRLRGTKGRRVKVGIVWRRFEVMLHVLVLCGLRMSELRGLPRDAVSLESRTLRVYQRADMAGHIGAPKSRHSYRLIPLSSGLVGLLREWLSATPDSPLLFPTASGKPISHQNLAKRMWQTVQEEAGVRVLNPHAARHFFASMRIQQGANLKALQVEIGHDDPMFTLRVYGHLFDDPEDVAARQAMADKMESALLPTG